MTLLQLCSFCSNTVWQKKSKKNFEITCFASIFFVPLQYQNSEGTTERVGSGRVAARHTLRKGSERDAERVGATCAKPRDNLPSEWRYEKH